LSEAGAADVHRLRGEGPVDEESSEGERRHPTPHPFSDHQPRCPLLMVTCPDPPGARFRTSVMRAPRVKRCVVYDGRRRKRQ